MKFNRTVTSLAILAIGVGSAATQASQAVQTARPPVPQRLTQPEVVLTGCIVQGTSSTVFIFDNAKQDPNSALEKGARYFLTSVIEDVDLRTHLNHVVRVTGENDLKVSRMPIREPTSGDPKGPGEERTLPRLVVRSLIMVSDKCPKAAVYKLR